MLSKHYLPVIEKLVSGKSNRSGILPFTEQPGEEAQEEQKKENINAVQLFSIFTADIIKAKVVFTR